MDTLLTCVVRLKEVFSSSVDSRVVYSRFNRRFYCSTSPVLAQQLYSDSFTSVETYFKFTMVGTYVSFTSMTL